MHNGKNGWKSSEKSCKLGMELIKHFIHQWQQLDNDDTDDGIVLASEMKSGASSEEESGNPDDGYDTDRCGRRGHSNWRWNRKIMM